MKYFKESRITRNNDMDNFKLYPPVEKNMKVRNRKVYKTNNPAFLNTRRSQAPRCTVLH